jgi:hypothetical protein
MLDWPPSPQKLRTQKQQSRIFNPALLRLTTRLSVLERLV